MIQLFVKGGPIMWPILFTSIVALTVVSERLFFILREHFKRQPRVVGEILAKVEGGDFDGAVQVGAQSEDFVAATLVYALENRDKSVSEALLRAASWEL
jgi:biopolymer transport protein ExbB